MLNSLFIQRLIYRTLSNKCETERIGYIGTGTYMYSTEPQGSSFITSNSNNTEHIHVVTTSLQ